MQRRRFGFPVDLPVIGQGTWNLELGERATAVATLRRGLDEGMTHIDTAEMYGDGRAERIVGEAIAGRRQEVFLVSKVLPWCEAHGLAVVAYSPFGHSQFPGPRTSGGRVLAEIAAAHDATARQVALAFLVRQSPLFAIPKTSDPDRASENAAAGALRLSAEELARIDGAFPLGARPEELPTL